MNSKWLEVSNLYDGSKTSSEIAKIVGLSPRYVRRIATKMKLPRLGPGARLGEMNHQFVSGRRIDLDGYVLVTAPPNHPYARKRTYREGYLIFEHRLVLEKSLGRYLLPDEVVDHIDGLTLHNDPANLRLFQCNGDHLRKTISGIPKRISQRGLRNIHLKNDPDAILEPVDIYYRRRERGDVRLRQILLAALSLGIDSPYLLGTQYHLGKAGIYPPSRSRIEFAWAALSRRWEQDLFE